MKGRSVAEVLTGAVVLLAAGIFLVYAIMHGGRTPQTTSIRAPAPGSVSVAGTSPSPLALMLRLSRSHGMALKRLTGA